MALLPILCYPDPRLHKVAQNVNKFDAKLQQLITNMQETMYHAQGIGLAATQIDVHERVVVIDISEERNQLIVLINPEIIWRSEVTQMGDEGCLSVPGIYDGVERSTAIRVKAQDLQGNWFEMEAEELLAVCIQHELDHLQGKVFVQYLSPFKRNRIQAKLTKKAKQDKDHKNQ